MPSEESGYYDAERAIDQKTGTECFFYKEHRGDKVWWVDYRDIDGDAAVTFDKKNILHLFSDYPGKFTPEQKEIFDKENPFWADFFKDRG